MAYCEPINVTWPVERLTSIWRATAEALGQDVLRPDDSDFGLSAFLFNRSQRICGVAGCYAQIVDPLSVWIDALSAIGREPGPTVSLACLIEPDPRRATARDLQLVAERASYAARFFRKFRDEYPASLSQAMQAQDAVGRYKTAGVQVPHEANNHLICCLTTLRSSQRYLKHIVNEIELVQHYATALLPDELATCHELNAKNWYGYGANANCDALTVELNRLAARIEWLKPPVTAQKPNNAQTVSKPAERRPTQQTFDWMLRRLEDERDGLAALPCKLVTVRFLHSEGDGRKYDTQLLQRYPQFAPAFKGHSVGDFGQTVGNGGRGSRHTRVFCDEVGDKTTQTELTHDDWKGIRLRLESLAEVANVILHTDLATDETRELCRDSDGAALWLRFVAGVSRQPSSPIDPAEITWPAVSELNYHQWSREMLCSPAMQDPDGLSHLDPKQASKIYVGLTQAPPPNEWINNPPSNFFQVTIERFLERSVKVCRWLIERLNEWSESSEPVKTPLVETTRDDASTLLNMGKATNAAKALMKDNPSRWMKFVEAEELSGINRGNIKRAADNNEIKDNGESGRSRRIDRESFTHWWQEKRRQPERKETVDTVNRKLNGEMKR